MPSCEWFRRKMDSRACHSSVYSDDASVNRAGAALLVGANTRFPRGLFGVAGSTARACVCDTRRDRCTDDPLHVKRHSAENSSHARIPGADWLYRGERYHDYGCSNACNQTPGREGQRSAAISSTLADCCLVRIGHRCLVQAHCGLVSPILSRVKARVSLRQRPRRPSQRPQTPQRVAVLQLKATT